jgi:hypothetical protein
MDKHEVIAEYCKLSAQVAEGVFDYAHAADCFCAPHTEGWNYQYEDDVLDYILIAVYEKMKREGHSIPVVT